MPLSVLALLCALAVILPVHLDSVDRSVLVEAGSRDARNLPWKVSHLLDSGLTGPARLLLEVQGDDGLMETLLNKESQSPHYGISGGEAPYFEAFLKRIPKVDKRSETWVPVMSILSDRLNRLELLHFLEASRISAVKAVIKGRDLSGLQVFMPVHTASGAPLEASILLAALMLQGHYFDGAIQGQIVRATDLALAGDVESIAELEAFYLSVLSLGHRMNYVQVTQFVSGFKSLKALVDCVGYLGTYPERMSLLYAAVLISEAPDKIVRYLVAHDDEEAMQSIAAALAAGGGALDLLLDKQQLMFKPRKHLSFLNSPPVLAAFVLDFPALSLFFKLTFLLLCVYALVHKLLRGILKIAHFSGKPLRHSLGTVFISIPLVIILWIYIEPGMTRQEAGTSSSESVLRLAGISTSISSTHKINAMNEITTDLTTLLVIALFLILQLMVYALCLSKLLQIKRLKERATLKLKLIENEDNLFDFGLYLGLGGTVLSLILLAMGVVSVSLIAAYTSTLFGILFVALLKIFHVRPYRRQLLIEADQREK